MANEEVYFNKLCVIGLPVVSCFCAETGFLNGIRYFEFNSFNFANCYLNL